MSTSPREKTVAIIQPYLARYNEPMFAALEELLAESRVRLRVIAGHPLGNQAKRNDTSRSSNYTFVRTQSLSPFPFDLKRTGSAIRDLEPDYLILEQARGHLESYAHLLKAAVGGPRVAWWGHGRAYHRQESGLAARWRQELLYRGDWFFAYTSAGASYVERLGFPASRISVLNNTIDTEGFAADLNAVTTSQVVSFLESIGATRGRVALFIGGVDSKKGIDLLLRAADTTSRLLPGFLLLIGGSGEMEEVVKASETAGAPIRYLGRLDAMDKAVAFRAADVLAIPKSIGLVAVESLVSGRPIVTTSAPGHGPEREYLTPGRTCIVADTRPEQYGLALADLLQNADRLNQLSSQCVYDSAKYTMTGMVDAFRHGIVDWMRVAEAGLGQAARRTVS